MMPMTLMQMHSVANWLHGNNTMLVHYFPMVAPLNPNPNPHQNPNQNPNPTCHHQFSTNAQLPHFVPPSSSEFAMDPRTSAPPLRYSAPYSMSPYPPPHISPRALPSASPASYLHLSDHASAWSALSGPSSHSHSSGVAHLQAELARLTPYHGCPCGIFHSWPLAWALTAGYHWGPI